MSRIKSAEAGAKYKIDSLGRVNKVVVLSIQVPALGGNRLETVNPSVSSTINLCCVLPTEVGNRKKVSL